VISVVIPIFNEEQCLPELSSRLNKVLDTLAEESEIILVDDGSTDGSYALIKSYAASMARIKTVKLSRNFGHQAAISAGLRYARGQAVVVMDSDLQDAPEDIPQLVSKWKEGFEVVYAVREKRKERAHRRISYLAFYRLLNLISEIDIPLDSGDFSLMDRKVVDILNNEMPEKIRFIRGLRAYAGFKQTGISVERSARLAGKEKYTYKKLFKLASDGLFGFSMFPLRLAVYLGFVLSIPSFLLGIFFIIHRILDFEILGHSPRDTPGLATLAVGFFFISGVLLIILGIIGEYIGRIYMEVKRRPGYVVEKTDH
jgi:dolichol-phosphate mannosyltransferase